jgi:hypothetical protein
VAEHILCTALDLVHHELLLKLTSDPPYGPYNTTQGAQLCILLQAIGTATLKECSAMLR